MCLRYVIISQPHLAVIFSSRLEGSGQRLRSVAEIPADVGGVIEGLREVIGDYRVRSPSRFLSRRWQAH